MTAPALAAARFAAAFALGLALGFLYGFLRPLRQKGNVLADLIFLLGTAASGVQLAFGICGGDLRLGYLAGMAAGGILFEATVGRLLRGVFGAFWTGVRQIIEKISQPAKKFLKKTKILFASAKKWGTIKWNNRWHFRRTSGGWSNGRKKESLPRRAAGLPPQQSSDQGRGDCGYCVVYGGVDHTALGPERH